MTSDPLNRDQIKLINKYQQDLLESRHQIRVWCFFSIIWWFFGLMITNNFWISFIYLVSGIIIILKEIVKCRKTTNKIIRVFLNE